MDHFQDRLAEFFQAISNIKAVSVVGDLILDSYQIGEVTSISPEAPVPILHHLHEEIRPGGAGNVVQNLSNLGVPVTCFGVVGADSEGSRLLALLSNKHNASTKHVFVDADRPTPLKNRLIARNQQLMRIDRETRAPLDGHKQNELHQVLMSSLKHEDLLFVSDYQKGTIDNNLIPKIRQQFPKIWISVDPKGHDYSRYRGTNLITPNVLEAQLATGMQIESEDDLVVCLAKLFKITHAPYICLTRSEKGMILYEGRTGQLTCQPAWSQREVFDVTGAGDTVLVFVGLGLSHGIDPRTTLKIASLAAYLVVQKFGASGITMHEIVQGSRNYANQDTPAGEATPVQPRFGLPQHRHSQPTLPP